MDQVKNLVIVYTDKNDKLKKIVWCGESTDRYLTRGNLIQWYELDGVKISYAEAFQILNGLV